MYATGAFSHNLLRIAPDGVGETVSHLYGTDNQRLLRRSGDSVTLYLAGMEMTATDGQVTANRFYSAAGQTVAWRDADGLYDASVDHHGSVRAAVDEATGVREPTQYLPYGQRLGGTAGVDRGFLGERHDPSGLVYLNNRHYDASTGVFVSVDPLATSTM